jgi:hypothetical protein
MEGELITWRWMAIPLVVLAVNLAYPRSRRLKEVALFLFILAAALHAFAAYTEIYRPLHAVERWISPGNKLWSEETALGSLAYARKALGKYGFQLFLEMTLAIILAAIPCDVLSRRSHRGVARET